MSSNKGIAGKVVGAVFIGLTVVVVVEYVTNKFGSVGKALEDTLAGLGGGLGKGLGEGAGSIWDAATERVGDAVSGLFGIPRDYTPDAPDGSSAPGSKLSDYQPPDFGPPTPVPSVIGTVPQPGGDTETLYSDGSYGIGGTW